MGQLLTDLVLRKLTSNGAERLEVWDEKMPGFGVRISRSGTKTFILLFRQNGRACRLSLGRYPALQLAEARKQARAALADVAEGREPKSTASTAHSPADAGFLSVVDRFVDLHCRRHNRISTLTETSRILRVQFGRVWGDRDIREIKRTDILGVLDDLINAGTPSAAIRALAAVSKFFNWCVERDLIDVSPCAKIRKPSKPVERERTLTTEELTRVWGVLPKHGFPFGVMVQLLILTGQRRGEVSSMHWRHIDFDKRLWMIPKTVTKNHREHLVPLSTRALEVLANVPRLSERFVFPARGNDDTSISGFSKSKKRLDHDSGVTGWTLHDLRRTAATSWAMLETKPHIIERILNHSSGTFGGVAGIYNRHPYLDEMRSTLEAWGEWTRQMDSASE